MELLKLSLLVTIGLLLPIIKAEQCSDRSKNLQNCMDQVRNGANYKLLKQKKAEFIKQCAQQDQSMQTCATKKQKSADCKEKLSHDSQMTSAKNQLLSKADSCFKLKGDPFFVLSSRGANKPAAGSRTKRQANKGEKSCKPLLECVSNAETKATQQDAKYIKLADQINNDFLNCQTKYPTNFECVASSTERQQCIKDASTQYESTRKSLFKNCMQ